MRFIGLDVSYDRVIVKVGGGVDVVQTTIPVYRFNANFDYVSCTRSLSTLPDLTDERNLVVDVSPSLLVRVFKYMVVKELKRICVYHGVHTNSTFKMDDFRVSLLSHNCVPACANVYYIFRCRARPRANVECKFIGDVLRMERQDGGITTHVRANRVPVAAVAKDFRTDAQDLEMADDPLEVASDDLRQSIIGEWQNTMSTSNMRRRGCAVCARLVLESLLVRLNASSVPLSLLRNDDLPEHLRPTEYDMEVYDMAILHPPGLSHKRHKGVMSVCSTCGDSLGGGVMPKFALANWLYYGRSVLPPLVKAAFDHASTFDLMLIARARASNICFRFGARGSSEDDVEDVEHAGVLSRVRKGIRGNVMVTPLDATRLNTVLPPDAQTISDTMCAVFVGRTVPTRSTIAKLSPVLVRRSRVKTMIEFLLKFNPHYRTVDGFKGFSAENLNSLFGKEDCGKDEAVPCMMEIGHVESNDAVESATSDYTPRNDFDVGTGEVIMENVGFTSSDDSPLSYRDMKMKALSHCLGGGSFISSRRGSRMVPDFNNPYLLSWLFPHLDPWGIGGFHDPRRKRSITMEEQLSYLLQIDGGPFEKDPEFAFVFYNIKQKKLVSQNVRFKVPQRRYKQIIQDLLDIDVGHLLDLESSFKADPLYRPGDDKERSLVRLLANVSMVGSNIPGSAAYKVSLRNQIRAVINYRGTPTLFITLNPSDVDHPLVRLNAGQDIDLDDVSRGEDLDKWSRTLLAAKNPSACAVFFHTMIKNFISVILRFGTNGRGLFGRCSSYYGSVEANGRGTLHCHMLVWLEGHPSPQILRHKMDESLEYKEKTFRWLESIIKCELLGTEHVVVETAGPLPRPNRKKETGDPHPGAIPSPLLRNTVSPAQFKMDFEGFVNALVKEYNWHVHTASCWKHLGRSQIRDDHNCRMGIDGHTRAETTLDTETASILVRRLHPRIASYNDIVIFLLKCNMDIKFIGSGEAAKAYLYYITDYITKPSLPVHVGLAALSYAVKQTSSKFSEISESSSGDNLEFQRGAMIMTVNSMMGHQEVSHQQVMSYLVGGGDHYTPDEFQTLHWGAFKALAGQLDERWRTLSVDAIESGSEPSVVLQLGRRSITASNHVFDYLYRSIDSEFDSMCLYEFFEWTKKVSLPVSSKEMIRAGHRDSLGHIWGGFWGPSHPQYDTHVLRIRKVPVIPVILGDKIPNPLRGGEDLEGWSRDVMLLFVPWRTLEDLRGGYDDWTSAYRGRQDDVQPKYRRIIQNLNVLSECRDARGELSRKWRDERKKDSGRHEVDDALETMLGQEDGETSPNVFDTFESQGDEAVVDLQHDSVIDSELGARSSFLLDFCLPLDTSAVVVTTEHGDRVTEVTSDDDAAINEQTASMFVLKRKRRPEHSDSPETSRRQRSRCDASDPRTAVVDLDTLAVNAVAASSEPGNQGVSSHWDIVQEVIEDMNMINNPEQTRALRIMARRIINGGPQLLMYVAGVGGTGKSHLVKALVELFRRLGRRREILLGAPTGIAAVLIGGYTMHSLSMTNPHRKTKDTQELVALWRGVKFLVIDEISMVGSLFLSQFSSRLKQAMSDDDVASAQPFGGVNVIFMGDFGQLKPPRQLSLFAYQLVNSPSFEESRHVDGINAMNGAFLWRQVNVVVKLTRNLRHQEDPDYAGFLERIRLGTSRPNSSRFSRSGCTDDLEFLRARELWRIVERDPGSLREFRDAPVIVGSREIRDAVNAKYVAFHAKRLTQSVHLYHAVDSVKRTRVSGIARDRLWKMKSRKTNDSLGKLPLFIGMKVMVTENIAFSKGIVNGVEGVVHSIKYTRDDEGNRYASVVYLSVDGVEMGIPGVSSGIVPIFPETVMFEWKYKVGDDVRSSIVSRKQLPLLPSYSYTDFKSQGRTLDRAIVDLSTARGQGVYVMLSRVKRLDGIVILRWFPSTKIYQRLPEDVRNELARIDFLDGVTTEAYSIGGV